MHSVTCTLKQQRHAALILTKRQNQMDKPRHSYLCVNGHPFMVAGYSVRHF
jgi:hypothetical protein